MRVGSVSSVSYSPHCRKAVVKNKESNTTVTENSPNVNFKGKFGQIVGGTIGAGAVLVASFVAAPAAACLAGAGLIVGLVGGDVAEDAINKEGDFKKKDNDKKDR